MRQTTLIGLLLVMLAATACATPAIPAATPTVAGPEATSTPAVPPVPAPSPVPAPTLANTGDLNVTLTRTGGLAGVHQTFVLKPDGSVDTGTGIKQVDGGAAAAAKLASQIAATGIYNVTPGKYLPSNPCCDRFTYDLTLTAGGKTYEFVTMDASETAPPALMQSISLVSQYIASAR